MSGSYQADSGPSWGRANVASSSSGRTSTQNQMNSTSVPRQTSSYPHSQAWRPTSASSIPGTQPSEPQSHSQQLDPRSRGYGTVSPLQAGRSVPVPSEEQVNDYLIAHMGQTKGLYTGWTIQGHQISVYSLFTIVVQMGGSSVITQQNQWPYVAQAMKFPLENLASSRRTRAYQRLGVELREFFLRMLGVLEILWEGTKAAVIANRHHASSSYQTAEAARRQELSAASQAQSSSRPPWSAHNGQTLQDDRPVNHTTSSSSGSHSGQHLDTRMRTDPTQSASHAAARAAYRQSSDTSTYLPFRNSTTQTYGTTTDLKSTPASITQHQPAAPATLAGYRITPQPSSSVRLTPESNLGSSAAESSSAGNANQQTGQTSSSSTARGSDHEAPLVSSFEDLVDNHELPLPPYSSGLTVPSLSSPYLDYAWRAHELRSSIRKMSAGDPHRHILPQEILWWNRLVLLLQKNPKVVIPKPASSPFAAPMNETTRAVQPQPNQPTTINPTSIQNLVQQPAPSSSQHSLISQDYSQAGPSSQVAASNAPLKKKRGRPPLSSQTPGGHGEGLDGLSGANTAPVPVKKRKARPPKEVDPNNPSPKKKKVKPIATQDPESVDATMDETPSSSNPFHPLTGDPPAPPPPKKSMRPAPDSQNAQSVSYDTVGGVSQSQPVSDPTVAPPAVAPTAKRPRGRPRKDPAVVAHGTGSLAGPSTVAVQPRPTITQVHPGDPINDLLAVYDPVNAVITTANGSSTPTLPGASTISAALANATGPDGQPNAEAGTKPKSLVASMAAKARWERYRAEGGPVPVGRKRMPTIVNSASPIRVLHLSGMKTSSAQITLRDAQTPTKVITKMKRQKKRSRFPQDAASETPETLADALTSYDAEEEDDFDPFMALSQTFMAASPPPKKEDAFVAYAPARPPAPRSKEEDAMPEEVDVRALAAALDAGLHDMAHGLDAVGDGPDAEGEDEMDFEVVDEPLFPRKRGKGKAKGKIMELAVLIEPVHGNGNVGLQSSQRPGKAHATVAPAQTTLPHASKGPKGARFTSSQASQGQRIVVEVPLPTSASSTPVIKERGKAAFKVNGRKEQDPSPAGPRVTRSRVPAPPPSSPVSAQPPIRKAFARRTVPKKGASRLTRSLGGPPSSSLRARPTPNDTASNVGRSSKRARISRVAESSPSIVAISPPPRKAPRKPRAKATEDAVKEEIQPPFVPGSVDRAVVCIPITSGRRRRLILSGRYTAFLHDDSEDDEPVRAGPKTLRPIKALPGKKTARSIRAREPEVLPDRFAHRFGPVLVEPFKSILREEVIVNMAVEHECDWKGCDAILGSEALLKKHLQHRQHTALASFQTGPKNAQILWQCHWYACEGPCFDSREHLDQHVMARHVSRVLPCPYEGCDLTSPNLSHLSRHVMRHEDDEPRPLSDLSVKLPPPLPIPDQIVPELARMDVLTTHTVPGTIHSSRFRRDATILKVKDNCFGGEHPVMHVEHPPHILQVPSGESDIDESDEEEELYDSAVVVDQKALDAVIGTRTRWEPVVLIPRRRWPAKRAVGAKAQDRAVETDVALPASGDAVSRADRPMGTDLTDKADKREANGDLAELHVNVGEELSRTDEDDSVVKLPADDVMEMPVTDSAVQGEEQDVEVAVVEDIVRVTSSAITGDDQSLDTELPPAIRSAEDTSTSAQPADAIVETTGPAAEPVLGVSIDNAMGFSLGDSPEQADDLAPAAVGVAIIEENIVEEADLSPVEASGPVTPEDTELVADQVDTFAEDDIAVSAMEDAAMVQEEVEMSSDPIAETPADTHADTLLDDEVAVDVVNVDQTGPADESETNAKTLEISLSAADEVSTLPVPTEVGLSEAQAEGENTGLPDGIYEHAIEFISGRSRDGNVEQDRGDRALRPTEEASGAVTAETAEEAPNGLQDGA